MSQLLIELNNPADEALLVQLVDRLQGRILSKTDPTEEKRQRLKLAMDKLAESKAGEQFGDASEWQREVRSWDRVLDGREE